MATDRLFFLDVKGRRIHEALWTGPWPPPERLSIMVGQQSGMVTVIEEGEAPADVVAAARELGTIIETRFRLRNCSQITATAAEDAHWFRGAEYVPEGDDR